MDEAAAAVGGRGLEPKRLVGKRNPQLEEPPYSLTIHKVGWAAAPLSRSGNPTTAIQSIKLKERVFT